MHLNHTLRHQQAMRHAWNRAALAVLGRAAVVILLGLCGIETLCLLLRLA